MFKKKRYIPAAKPRNYRPDFARYTQEKRAWLDANPNCAPGEYQEAMREIAQRCGI